MKMPKNFVLFVGFDFGQEFKITPTDPETWVTYDSRYGATLAVDAASPEGIEYLTLMKSAKPFGKELIDKLNASATATAFYAPDLANALAV